MFSIKNILKFSNNVLLRSHRRNKNWNLIRFRFRLGFLKPNVKFKLITLLKTYLSIVNWTLLVCNTVTMTCFWRLQRNLKQDEVLSQGTVATPPLPSSSLQKTKVKLNFKNKITYLDSFTLRPDFTHSYSDCKWNSNRELISLAFLSQIQYFFFTFK